MGSFWGLVLSLFFCCWEAGAAGSSAGPSTREPGPLVTMNHTELPAVTLRVNTSSEGASQTGLAEPSVSSHIPLETQTLDTQTFDRILIPASTSESETRETKNIFSATETRALTKITPSKCTVVMTIPVETSATSGSSSGAGTTTVETVTGSDLLVAVFDILCTDDSSEEAKITIDALPLAYTSTEARALALESNSAPAITSSQTLAPDVTVPPKALVAYTVTDIAVTNCSVTELETTAISAGTSDIDHSPSGGRETLSTPEMSALPDFTEAKSHLTRIVTSSETLSTASTIESVTPDTTGETPHIANSTTQGESTAAQATASSGTLMTVSISPLEETLPLSVETTSHTKVSGAVTIPTEAGSTVGKATSSAGSSGMVYSHSEVATIQKSTRSETFTTHSTTSGPVLISRSPLPSVLLTTTNSSQETDITSAKTTASAKTSKTASTAGGKPPTASPTTAETRWTTEDTTDGGEGFLLLRLSVASPEDLTDPRVAKRLMHQLHHELHTHMPSTQVSLLRVRRD